MKLPIAIACFLAAFLVAKASAQISGPGLSKIASDSTTAQALTSEVPTECLRANFSDADVFRLRAFAEPLVADTKGASEEERAAFFRAINGYLLDKRPEGLESFLRAWPQSRWAAALSHNLGIVKYQEGYFTAAIEYWKSSWELARDSKDPRLRALGHQSVAELAKMQARLGRIEELKPLLGGLSKSQAGGAARQMLESSAEALQRMETQPGGSSSVDRSPWARFAKPSEYQMPLRRPFATSNPRSKALR
jgi:hypothetical protein